MGKKVKTEMTLTVENITVKEAEELLAKNWEKNRPYKKSTILRFSRLMRKGMWVSQTPQVIALTDKGALIDGQHRLQALIQSGSPQILTVVRGVPHTQEVFEALDVGVTRNPADWIGAEEGINRPQAMQVSAGLRMYYQYLDSNFGDNKIAVASQEVLSLHRKNPRFGKIIADDLKLCKQNGSILSVSWSTCFKYIFLKIDKDLAEKFIYKLHTGDKLSVSDPIMQLRDRLQQNKISRHKMSRASKIKLIMQAWNMKRSNTRGAKLIVPEEYPELV